MSTFASELRTALTAKGRSATDVARAIGVYPSNLSQYLAGKMRPSAQTLAKLEAELAVSFGSPPSAQAAASGMPLVACLDEAKARICKELGLPPGRVEVRLIA